MRNLILTSDSYKLTHAPQYPPGTTNVYSYFESRASATFPLTTFFGLQSILKKYLLGRVVTKHHIEEAAELCKWHFGNDQIFNKNGWLKILEWGGRLPLNIWAVPEGSRHPTGTVLMTVENTDPECFWLTNFVETLLSHVWYPSTVATLSREAREMFLSFLRRCSTEDPETLVQFMLHDFGCRGVSSMESAAIGGAAHLINFKGTDTVPALVLAQRDYGAKMPAFSVPASEHSTMTTWGETGEKDAFANMLETYPTGIVSIVSDSWNLKNAIRDVVGSLKHRILQREGRVVIRPDSGDPVETNLMAAQELAAIFGSTPNEKGYLVLNDKVRLLQGDGMELETLREFLIEVTTRGWSPENWVFGMGGGLLQKVNRDTQSFAFKCSSTVVMGEQKDVFKRPATDPAKNSKRGRFTENLEPVFLNGELVRDTNWETVIENSNL